MPPVDAPRISGPSRLLPRWLLIVAAALLVARVGTGVWENRHPPMLAELVHWIDLTHAEAESKARNRPILYEFSADWCEPCKVMSREIFAADGAARRIDRMFVPVRVLDRQQEEGRNSPAVQLLEERFAVKGFPTLVVAWPGVEKYTSISGYRGRQATEEWLTRQGMQGRFNPPAHVDSVLRIR